MLFSLTNISGITGLSVIFITAALVRNGMEWLPGVVFLLLILAVRNVAIEVTRKKEILLSISVFVIVILTLLFLIN